MILSELDVRCMSFKYPIRMSLLIQKDMARQLHAFQSRFRMRYGKNGRGDFGIATSNHDCGIGIVSDRTPDCLARLSVRLFGYSAGVDDAKVRSPGISLDPVRRL